MSEELKKCPFCGNSKRYSYDHKEWSYLRLILEGMSLSMKSVDVDRAYNTRYELAEVSKLREELNLYKNRYESKCDDFVILTKNLNEKRVLKINFKKQMEEAVKLLKWLNIDYEAGTLGDKAIKKFLSKHVGIGSKCNEI